MKGEKLAGPEEVVRQTRKRLRLKVSWYGGGQRSVEVVVGTGYWYRAGGGLVEIRWVFVHDLTGTHRDDYFFTTDLSLRASEIIEIFTGRWSIETMFQEMRAYLGLETTRGRTRSTVLSAAPMLFALYSLVVLLYSQLPSRWKSLEGIRWEGKSTVTFSDVITRVRCWLWSEWVFETLGKHHAFSKLPHRFRDTILHALAAVV